MDSAAQQLRRSTLMFQSVQSPYHVFSSEASPPTCADFNVNLDRSGYTMSAAGVAVVTVRVNSIGYGPVHQQANGMPPGVNAKFSRTSLQSGVATLMLMASSGATERTYRLRFGNQWVSRAYSHILRAGKFGRHLLFVMPAHSVTAEISLPRRYDKPILTRSCRSSN